MNTLPKAITAQFFPDASSYAALRRHWSALVRSDCRHDLTATHHLLYRVLLGKDWRAGFTPITNTRKLDNGAYPGWVLFRALWELHAPWKEQWLLAPFEGLVTVPMLELVRQVVPKRLSHNYQPAAFTPGMFPFDAYEVPAALLAPAKDRTYA
jgi:hypothetical protein